MSCKSRLFEDLPRLAAEAYELADRLCGSCRNMHALWPYIRLSRTSIGIETGESGLDALLASLFAGGRRKVLIAGSQDTGLLTLVARAGADCDIDIAVLDRCDTPLEMCRRLAQRWSLPIQTVQQDLRGLDMEARFDVVLVHGTLQFVAADHRPDILARLARALRPNGRLVHQFYTNRRIPEELWAENRGSYSECLLGELERLNIPLPEAREGFRARVDAHAQDRKAREGTFADHLEVETLMKAAGFVVESLTSIDPDIAAPHRAFLSRIATRRFMAVARPDRDNVAAIGSGARRCADRTRA